ncbi:MAG: efflux RND transporter periplasmic adaptor subunit [Planctomycetota bacterium]
MFKTVILNTLVYGVLAAGFYLAATDGKLPWRADPPKSEDPNWCGPHQVALDQCELCNPALRRGGTQVVKTEEPRAGQCPNTCVRITLGTGVAEAIGLELITVETREVSERVSAAAETKFAPNRTVRVTPRLDAYVAEIRVSLGQDVAAGDVLAVLESPEFAAAKAAYRQARDRHRLEQRIHDGKKALHPQLTTREELLTAEIALEAARLTVEQSVLSLVAVGLSRDEITAVAEAEIFEDLAATGRFELRAPSGGTVVSLVGAVGERVTRDAVFCTIADLDELWLELRVDERELERLRPEQKLTFTSTALEGRRFSGSVLFSGAEVDERTRTGRVIARVKNTERLLRAGMVGAAEVRVRTAEPKLLLPREAVQDDGDCRLAFVSTSRDVFVPRKLDIVRAFAGGFEVAGGVSVGERVATTGSFLLKTEIMRGQIGVG